MCGRYASARKRIELLEEFGVQRDRVAEDLRPDYNVAPTKPVYAVLTRHRGEPSGEAGHRGEPSGEAGQRGKSGQGGQDRGGKDAGEQRGGGSGEAAGTARELRVVRWGLVPFWAKDVSIGSRMINARAETVSEKPAFRRAFAKRRCLLPADGYYEWQQLGEAGDKGGGDQGGAGQGGAGQGGGAKGKPVKQPYFIHRADGHPLAFAGLYELWRDKSVPEDDDEAWLWTATVITTSAPDELGRIHDRMPMIIDPGRWADWLDPDAHDPGELRSLLVPAASSALETYPVSTAVNSVRHNGPELIEPLDAGTTGR